MINFNVNIIMLTYRSDFIAKVNLKIALETIIHHSNVRLIVGYGGVDDLHYNWLDNLRSEINEKSSFELISEISGAKRTKWALSFPSDWIIFISDDDIISSNYLSVLIKEINIADNSISNIFSQNYGLSSGPNVEYIKLINILDSNAFNRAKSLIGSPHIGVRYYSAHRAGSISKIITEKVDSDFFPSYLDQLITLSTVLNGKSISCSEPNVLIYNIENWINLEACIRSDSKIYKIEKMVFFHEVLWISDYINILHPHCIDRIQYEWIKNYCLDRINDNLNAFIPRLNIIEIEELEVKSILAEINRLAIAISSYENIADLIVELNQCKNNILNKINNEIYFGPYV